MLPNNLWQEELLLFSKNKKTMIIKILLPFILTSPIFFQGIPDAVKSGIFTLAIIFIGIFSSTIGLIQLKDSKMLERLALLPISKKRLVLEYIFVRGFLDSIKFVLPLGIIIILNFQLFSATAIVWLIICYLSTIFAANSFGIIFAIVSGSSAEAHLYAIISVLLIVVVSGVFGTFNFILLDITSSILPFRYFSNSLIFFLSGHPQDLFFLAPISSIVIIITTLIISSNLFKF